ncbi:MAG: hypothetical protein VYD54_03300 [Bdellovibrionota bacterium]|nr:hypothetical protein [Bdellovibrionota bacterium]
MELFKKLKPTKHQKVDEHQETVVSIDKETKEKIRKIKHIQERYIEDACFYMVQEKALEKAINCIQQTIFLKGEGNSSTEVDDINALENEIVRLITLLQKKIEKFLLTEKTGEKVPPIRNFLIQLKEMEKSDSSYQEISFLKKILKVFLDTKDNFNKERIENLSLANEYQKKQKKILGNENTATDISFETSFVTNEAEKALNCQIFSNRKGLEKILN